MKKKRTYLGFETHMHLKPPIIVSNGGLVVPDANYARSPSAPVVSIQAQSMSLVVLMVAVAVVVVAVAVAVAAVADDVGIQIGVCSLFKYSLV